MDKKSIPSSASLPQQKTDPPSRAQSPTASDGGRQHAAELTFIEVASITGMPDSPEAILHLNKQMDAWVFSYLEGKLSRPDYEQIERRWRQGEHFSESELARLRFALDEFILDKAKFFGVRILTSALVLNRLLEWHGKESDGVKLISKFAKNIVLAAEYDRGQRRRPMTDPEVYPFKQDVIVELKLLRTALLQDPRDVKSTKVLLGAIRRELTKVEYDRLGENTTAFLTFVQSRIEIFKDFLNPSRKSSRVGAAELADEFISHSFGYKDPHSARKAVSRLGSQKRRRK